MCRGGGTDCIVIHVPKVALFYKGQVNAVSFQTVKILGTESANSWPVLKGKVETRKPSRGHAGNHGWKE